MPIYEYECEDCGKVFELVKQNGPIGKSCPECQCSRTHRVVSIPAKTRVGKYGKGGGE